MDFTSWQPGAAAIALGAAGGLLFWIIASLALLAGNVLPVRPPFATDLLASAGDRERLRHRAEGRRLATLLAAMLAGALTGTTGMLLLPALRKPDLPDGAWIAALVLGTLVFAAAVFFVVRILLVRRRLQFAWAAKAAVGTVLKRLNLAGNSIYHDVTIDTAMVDHVVVGRKGVFALNVVARPVPKTDEDRAVAELKNGKLWMGDSVEALPVGNAARNMTLMSTALTRVVGHRVPVRSVLVVPGWHTVPKEQGNHLVLSERNLAMLTSWNSPDAFLMDEDCLLIQAFLHEASRARRLA